MEDSLNSIEDVSEIIGDKEDPKQNKLKLGAREILIFAFSYAIAMAIIELSHLVFKAILPDNITNMVVYNIFFIALMVGLILIVNKYL